MATELSIQFWVTADFKAATPEVADYIHTILEDANKGFENSDISITLKASACCHPFKAVQFVIKK